MFLEHLPLAIETQIHNLFAFFPSSLPDDRSFFPSSSEAFPKRQGAWTAQLFNFSLFPSFPPGFPSTRDYPLFSSARPAFSL